LTSFSIGALAQEQASPSSTSLLGFTAQGSKAERDWEERFRRIPDAKRIHTNMAQLAAHPNNVGSDYQRKNAEWLVARYKEWGWEAHIEQFDVLYPTPKLRVLELAGPARA
jgi:N-acetylated-alpha-linked acidic dipeptidase